VLTMRAPTDSTGGGVLFTAARGVCGSALSTGDAGGE
jgi:hypothetical protein